MNIKTFIYWLLLIFLLSIFPSKSAENFNLSMPEAVTNNAVAQVNIDGNDYLLSFSGLSTGKTFQDIHNKGYLLNLKSKQWRSIRPVPLSTENLNLTQGLVGRLASVAASINNKVYIFGGYTVVKDHSEVSIGDVYSYNVLTNTYQLLSPMPVPVDDSVALPYQNKFIYLISGWHNSGNVNLVQVYNTKTNSWRQATPFPGKPVFGHAGGIVNNKLLICDGVAIKIHKTTKRSYQGEAACYLGIINEQRPTKIDWKIVEHPTNKARYRMAARGIALKQQIVFLGGSENPYNYNGIGYNGKPSQPSNQLWIFDLVKKHWQIKTTDHASMDHRGLLYLNHKLITLGGMGEDQRVLNTVKQIPLNY